MNMAGAKQDCSRTVTSAAYEFIRTVLRVGMLRGGDGVTAAARSPSDTTPGGAVGQERKAEQCGFDDFDGPENEPRPVARGAWAA